MHRGRCCATTANLFEIAQTYAVVKPMAEALGLLCNGFER
jgi:hypothetical protein